MESNTADRSETKVFIGVLAEKFAAIAATLENQELCKKSTCDSRGPPLRFEFGMMLHVEKIRRPDSRCPILPVYRAIDFVYRR